MTGARMMLNNRGDYHTGVHREQSTCECVGCVPVETEPAEAAKFHCVGCEKAYFAARLEHQGHEPEQCPGCAQREADIYALCKVIVNNCTVSYRIDTAVNMREKYPRREP